MKFGVTKVFCAVIIAFLFVVLGSTAQTQKQADCGKAPGHGNPPWFDTEGKCNLKQRTLAYERTYVSTNSVGWPNRNNRDCYFRLDVCILHLSRKTIVPLGTKCPEAKDFAQPTICCDEFNKAVKSKQPCDPMEDADCDGIPNDKDDDPLKPNQKSPPKPLTRNMVAEAIKKEFQDRNLKLPSIDIIDLIRKNENGWGFVIPMDDNGMPIVIVGGVEEAPDGSMSVTMNILRHYKNEKGQWNYTNLPKYPKSSGSGGCGQDGLNQALGKALDQANLSQYPTGT